MCDLSEVRVFKALSLRELSLFLDMGGQNKCVSCCNAIAPPASKTICNTHEYCNYDGMFWLLVVQHDKGVYDVYFNDVAFTVYATLFTL